MPTSVLSPDRRRTFGHGTDVLDLPVDVLGRHRFRSSLQPGTVSVKRSTDLAAEIGFAGTSILFNKRTWIGSREMGFWEQIAPQAVTKTLMEADVRFLQNHNPDLLLARTNPQMRAAGTATLRLTTGPAGLQTDADMAPTSYATDLAILLDRGDISQMSFAFDPLEWTREQLPDGSQLITITELRLYDVSVVTYPAYEETDAGLRAAAFDALCRDLDRDPTDVLKRFAQGGPTTMPKMSRALLAPPTPTKRDRVMPSARSLNGWTFDDLWPLLDDAIVDSESTETWNAYWDVWIIDVSDEWVVYMDCGPDEDGPTLYQCTYTIDADGTVTLGAIAEVIVKTTYLPAATEDAAVEANEPPMGEPTEFSAAEAQALRRRMLSTRTAQLSAAG